MKIAISGMRDIGPLDHSIIATEIADILSDRPDEILFGGARGADTVALAEALSARKFLVKLTVIVPGFVEDQPIEAQKYIKRADLVIELGSSRLDMAAYRERNEALVSRADRLVAFWDGHSGGTGMTIGLAKKAGKPVHICHLSGKHVESL